MRHRYGAFTVYFATGLFLLLLAVMPLTFLMPGKAKNVDPEKVKSLTRTGSFPVYLANAQAYYGFGDNLVRLEESSIAIIGRNGNEKLYINLPFRPNFLAAAADRLFVFPQADIGFITIDHNFNLEYVETSTPVANLTADFGKYAYISQSENGTGIIAVYDPKQKKHVLEMESEKDLYPTDLIFPDADHIDVTSFDRSHGSKTVLSRYNLSGDKVFNLEFSGALTPEIIADKGGIIYLKSDKKLVTIEAFSGKILGEQEFSQIYDNALIDDTIYLLAADMPGGSGIFVLPPGKTLATKIIELPHFMPNDTYAFSELNKKFYLQNHQSISVYSLPEARLIAAAATSEDAEKIMPMADGSFMVLNDLTAQHYAFK